MPFTRRQVLSFAAAAPVVNVMRIVVTGGHPGDPEYGCGGAIARYTAQGHSVAIVYLNRGEKTCSDPPLGDASYPRVGEARKACAILGARAIFAPQCDGHAILDSARYDAFFEIISREQPDVLFTQWPIDNHRDHRAVSLLAYDAWVKLKRKPALYYYEVSNGEDTSMFTPTDFVEIESVEEKKRAACFAHASQSPERYYALQSEVARFRGHDCGCKLAEAFARHPGSRAGLLP